MLLKPGVTLYNLRDEIRRVLPVVNQVFELGGESLVITSTDEGSHGDGSLHYVGRAIDCRMPKSNVSHIVDELKRRLGPDFDVILEPLCVHIEHDPEKKGGLP